MTRWGETVVGWLDLEGDERVLDAGCGTGRVTAMLLERLPRGRVIALDGSPSMMDAGAQARLGERSRVEYLVADLTAPLPIDAPGGRDPVDGDVPLDPRSRRAVREPGRRRSSPADSWRPSAAAPGTSPRSRRRSARWVRTSPAASTSRPPRPREARLLAAGFTDIETWLHDEPTDARARGRWSRTSRRSAWATTWSRWRDDERARFVHEVAIRLPGPRIDYVRLNIRASPR